MVGRTITQLSIFVNNEPGRLAQVVSVMKDCGINMLAFNLAESTEFGILRVIVDDVDSAYESLRSKGVIVRKTDIVGIRIDDTPGSTLAALSAIGAAGLNIEYGYAFTGKNSSMFFLKVNDPKKASEYMIEQGLPVISAGEI